MEVDQPRRRRWVVVLLCSIPLWLLVSGGLGIWGYLRSQRAEQKKEAARFATVVSAASMADDFHKLVAIIGARSPGVDEGKGLTRAASWIEGILGPSNTGYAVQKSTTQGSGTWPILRIDLQGSDEKAAPVWILTSYESPVEEPGLSDASSAVVSAVAAAQALAGEKPLRPVRFVFLPPDVQEGARDSLLKMLKSEPAPETVVLLGTMRSGEGLSVAADPSNPVRSAIGALGTAQLPSAESNSWLESLSGAGIPVASICSDSSKTAGDEHSESEILATSTGRLVELIRRLMVRK